jgi:hypothetical protein
METHSKSWRGPREFFREILIIVVGVLIELSGQQAVDWIHQQNELAETREALRDEIAQNASLVALGSALDRCRFAMTEKYEGWARGGPQPEILPGIAVPVIGFSVWEVAKAGALSRMPVKERLSYSLVYDHLAILQRNIDQQVDLNLTLAQFNNQQQLNLSPDQAQRLLELSSAARALITAKDRFVPGLQNEFQTLGISPEPVSDSRRERLNDLCQAAGMPAPTL